ncbi:anti-sigma F factor antagonist [Sporosalibacterium faouarense]|uniref:anti-sigma F factor antagonist n=1 Tax=Sporosalibacterium faouarense TaxID=516123 RepID=UPI00141CF5F2|nr:anti-sigma F factor antagonist [Bacillota bacterium]
MQLHFNVKDENLIVRFTGELDHHTAQEIRNKIDNKYKNDMLKNIILDLKGINFMDSSGIGLIMGRYKTTRANDGSLVLINVNSRMEKILTMSGILKIVKVYRNEDEALHNI